MDNLKRAIKEEGSLRLILAKIQSAYYEKRKVTNLKEVIPYD